MIEFDAKTNEYLLLQRVTTLVQESDEEIVEYFESLARHLSSAAENDRV